jgi:pyruvate formate lyase activating enzyme
MKIGGFQEISLLDYPGKIAAIIWTMGCNFRCPFCYNPDLVFERTKNISVNHILSFLEERKGKLDAVSISGGEPFLQRDLKNFITRIRDIGYLVKVDTNGSYPKQMKYLLQKDMIDYLSMDVKATKEKYKTVINTSIDIKLIDTSIDLIKNFAKDYEFKTTVIPRFHKEKDIMDIAQWLKGSKRYFLQQFKTNTSLVSPDISNGKPYSYEELLKMCEKIKPFFNKCQVRGV